LKQLLLWLIVAMVLLIGLLLYSFRSANDLNVTPEAEREIEKAKRQ
jgi:CHASE3 domain sensor protein